jgi:hypothetical protein
MVVEVVEAAHTSGTVIPSPSDVYSDFLDQKNGVTWDPSDMGWPNLLSERRQ